jgi:hypothetical protein
MEYTYSEKERNKIYRESLKKHMALQPNQKTILCTLLGCHSTTMEQRFPEFYLFRPKENIGYEAWFSKCNDDTYYTDDVKSHQRMILTFCIEMTK